MKIYYEGTETGTQVRSVVYLKTIDDPLKKEHAIIDIEPTALRETGSLLHKKCSVNTANKATTEALVRRNEEVIF